MYKTEIKKIDVVTGEYFGAKHVYNPFIIVLCSAVLAFNILYQQPFIKGNVYLYYSVYAYI